MTSFIEENNLQQLDTFNVLGIQEISSDIFEDENINNFFRDFIEQVKIQYPMDAETIDKVNQLSFKHQVAFYSAYANIANGVVTFNAMNKDDTSDGVNVIKSSSVKSIMDKFISQPTSFIVLSNAIYQAIDAALKGESEGLARTSVGLIKDGISCIFNIGKFVDGIFTARYDLSIQGANWLERLKTYYTTVGDINGYQAHYAYDLQKETLTRYTKVLNGASEIPINVDDIVIKNLSPIQDTDSDVMDILKSITHGNPSSEVAGIDDGLTGSIKPINPDVPEIPTVTLKPIVHGDPNWEIAGIDDNVKLLAYNPIGTGADSVPLPQSSYMKDISPVLKGIFTYGGVGLDFMGAGISIYDFIKAAKDGEIKPQHTFSLSQSIMGLGASIMTLAKGMSVAGNVMSIVSALSSIAFNLSSINPENGPLGAIDGITNSFGLGSIASSAVASKEYSDAASSTTSVTEREIYEALAEIKKLDAIPVVNWFSAIYTSVDMDDIKDEILSDFGGIDINASNEEKQRALSNALRSIINEKYHDPLEDYSNTLLEKTNADVVQIATLATTDDTSLTQIFKGSEIPGEKVYSVTYEVKDGQEGFQTEQLHDNNYILDQQLNRRTVATDIGSSITLSSFGYDYVKNRILVVDYRDEELGKLENVLKSKGNYGPIRFNSDTMHSAEYTDNEGAARIDLNIQALDFYKGIDSKIYAPLTDVTKAKVTFGSGNDNLIFSKIQRVSQDSSKLVSAIADGGNGYDSVSLKEIPLNANETYETKFLAEENMVKVTGQGSIDVVLRDFENVFLPGNDAINKVSLHPNISNLRPNSVITLDGQDASRNEIDFEGLQGTALRFIGTHKGNMVRATEENDELYATLRQDNSLSYGTSTFYGLGGNDKLIGGKGADFIYGGEGDDTIYGNGGADTVEGENGDDIIYYNEGMVKVDGGEGNDILNLTESKTAINLTSTIKDVIGIDATGFEGMVATAFDDTLHAFADVDSTLAGGKGNDTIVDNNHNGYLMGEEDDDTINGNGGNDTIIGGIGSDNIHGGTGDDTIFGGLYSTYESESYGLNSIYGDEGEDTIYGDSGVDNIYGGTDNDYINGRQGNDILYGGSGNDTIEDLDGLNKIYGEDGDDNIYISSNNEIIDGGNGIDTLDFSNVNINDNGININLSQGKVTFKGTENTILNIENVVGTNAIDNVVLNDIDNNVEGRAGNDTIYGKGGRDFIYGGEGDDTLYGEVGDDTLSGGDGLDIVDGGTGNDRLKGDGGNDVLKGGDGIDTLFGGVGADTLYGGEGQDSFIMVRDFQEDTIKDYSSADRIVFDVTTGIKSLDDIVFEKQENSLILKQSTANRIIIENYFSNENTLNINIGDEIVNQNSINDKITDLSGGIPSNAIKGDDTSNRLEGNDSDNSMYGFGDWDVLYGRGGNDEMYGGNGRDTINGEDGNDYLYGESDIDGITGGNGDDHLFGGEGGDNLEGNAGSDMIDGGVGNDNLSGGAGIDSFIFGKDFGKDVMYALSQYEKQDVLVFQSESGVSTMDNLNIKRLSEYDAFFDRTYDSLIIESGSNSITIRDWFKSGYDTVNMQIGGQNISANINQLVS